MSLPAISAKLAPLDFERLLPPKIPRLFVRQDFGRIGICVDGFQFCQTITSFSRTMP
jgi:hypothetical protein